MNVIMYMLMYYTLVNNQVVEKIAEAIYLVRKLDLGVRNYLLR